MNSYLGPQGKVLSGLKASNWKNARESKAPLMAWDTAPVQRDIDACSGQPVEADRLRRIPPTHTGGINVRGIFDFPVTLYPERTLPMSRPTTPSHQCSGLMNPDTDLGENGRHEEVSDEQAT
ncbi:hypothetical protein, partial [Burkholderia cepacia]|uniref:hypothetical protein n=1 Tax=Burkholderia cepacia TaxID=292 RepID=UPI001C896F58